MDDHPDTEVLSEGKAARVLDRAARLDAEGPSEVRIDDLRKAALGAGIPLQAFERALQEVTAAPPSSDQKPLPAIPVESAPEQRPKGSRLGTWLRRAVILGVGSALAGMSLVLRFGLEVDDVAAILFSMIISVFMVVNLVVKRRPNRAVGEFASDLAAFWVGLTMVWMIADPGEAMGVLAGMSLFGGLAGLLGGLIVRRPKSKSLPRDETEDPEPGLLYPAST